MSPPLVPPVNVRMAALESAARHLLTILTGSGPATSTAPDAAKVAEAAFVRAAEVCPPGAIGLLSSAQFTAPEVDALRAVVAFPPIHDQRGEVRRDVLEPFLTSWGRG